MALPHSSEHGARVTAKVCRFGDYLAKNKSHPFLGGLAQFRLERGTVTAEVRGSSPLLVARGLLVVR